LVRSYAATAIGSLGAREEIARLETAFRRENSDQGKVGFYEALYKLRRNAALAPLLELLQNPDYQVRCATANTLSTLSFGRQDASVVLAALRRALRAEGTVAAKSSIRSSVRAVSQNVRT
jgi:HEAT repeat protein